MSGWTAGGVVSGLFFGPIGAGASYVVAATSHPHTPLPVRLRIADQPQPYQELYEKAFDYTLKQRRKRATLRGGIIGTAVIVVAYAATAGL